MMRTCTTNITMPVGEQSLTVSLEVEFEVSPPDPSVGIFGCGVECFTAKVIDVDIIENVTPDDLAVVQSVFDSTEPTYRDEIEEACLESLDDGSDDRGGD